MPSSAKDRRERAAQARAAAEAGAVRRERLVRIIGGAVVALVVVGIVGGAWWVSTNESSSSALVIAEADPNAPLPTGVRGVDDAFPFAVAFGTGAATAPAVEIWEDMQCPACGDLEVASGAQLATAAESGDIQLLWRPVTFLDRGTDASTRAVAAWGCAIDAGKTREYHDRIYADQPQGGEGWTDEQLLQYGEDVGITGTDFEVFSQCLLDRTYAGWAANSTQAAVEAGIQGTPTVLVDGSEEVAGQSAGILLRTEPEIFFETIR
jgi:protein-disulfide isomerase